MGEATHPFGVFFFIPTPVLIFISRVGQGSISSPGIIRVWDTQKGVAIKDASIQDLGEIAFSGDQSTVTVVTKSRFHVYRGIYRGPWWEQACEDEPCWEQICEGGLLSSPNSQLGAYWADETPLLFATSSKTDRELVIDIRELRPTSDPPLHVVESLFVPPQSGRFSFCPVSSHASFVSETGVVILDAWDSKVLFQTKATQLLYTPPGQFSADGRFFACGTSREEVFIWENTTAGYVPWSILRPRLPFEGFLFSPTAVSILSWGPGGVQLSHLNNSRGSLPPPNEIEPHRQGGNSLMASSAGLELERFLLGWGQGDVQLLHPNDEGSHSSPNEIKSHHRDSNHPAASSTGGMHDVTAGEKAIVVSRKAVVDPGMAYFCYSIGPGSPLNSRTIGAGRLPPRSNGQIPA
jgi:hypothetical protein